MSLKNLRTALSRRTRQIGPAIETTYPLRAPRGLLAGLFEAEGTDKSCYADGYELLLAPRRNAIANVLEIGIGTLDPEARSSMHGWAADHYRPGGSLRAWRAYFPHARIVGIDIQPDTQFTSDRISTAICDSTDSDATGQFLKDRPQFDLVIDDGSHEPEDQLATLTNLLRAVSPGGLYVIEDIDSNSPLYYQPQIIEPLIGSAAYMTIDYSNLRPDPGKNIVIQAAVRT
jgi:hypothetical protein